ncbi:MAG: UvrB/UvrC motif-containing protein, partial [Bacteroidetes bacterium]|nr:UvrB/UvrC motif-containing protein [Bacteroidota bacterium]
SVTAENSTGAVNSMDKLEKDLQKAIESENYELAAKLRDQINLLKSS